MASSASSPLIGISSYLEPARFGVWELESALLPRGYLDGVVAAGGTPVLLPPIGHWDAGLVSRLDGLVIAGGADIDPARYRAERRPETGPPRADRDGAELALVAEAFEQGTPVLGVCRGMQLISVALGGTLFQHLPDEVGNDDHLPVPGSYGQVRVKVSPGSRLAEAVGQEVEVACHHHQAVDRLGVAMLAVAWADDGTVEGIEFPGSVFVVGVQWHPEVDGTGRSLFEALVREAR